MDSKPTTVTVVTLHENLRQAVFTPIPTSRVMGMMVADDPEASYIVGVRRRGDNYVVDTGQPTIRFFSLTDMPEWLKDRLLLIRVYAERHFAIPGVEISLQSFTMYTMVPPDYCKKNPELLKDGWFIGQTKESEYYAVYMTKKELMDLRLVGTESMDHSAYYPQTTA